MDFYLICHDCKERVFLTEDGVNRGDIEAIHDFVIKHGKFHDVCIGDNETEYKTPQNAPVLREE